MTRVERAFQRAVRREARAAARRELKRVIGRMLRRLERPNEYARREARKFMGLDRKRGKPGASGSYSVWRVQPSKVLLPLSTVGA